MGLTNIYAKYLTIVLLLCASVCSAQVNTTTIPGKLKIKTVPNTVVSGDSLVTIDASGNVKKTAFTLLPNFDSNFTFISDTVHLANVIVKTGWTINNPSTGHILNFNFGGVNESFINSDGQLNGVGIINPTAFASRVNTATSGTFISRGIADATNAVLRVQNYNQATTSPILSVENYYQPFFLMNYEGSVVHTPSSTAVAGFANGYHMFGFLKPSANGDELDGIQIEPLFGSSTISTTGSLTGGTGYPTGTQYVLTTGGTGRGAVFNVTISGGTITSATMTNGGVNYTNGDVLTFIVMDSTGSPVGSGGTVTVTGITSYTGIIKYALRTKNAASIFAPSTTGYGSIILPSGTGYTGTSDGTLWNDGTHLYGYIQGAKRQLDRQTGSTTVLTFATLPTGVEGMMIPISDSNTNTWGATVAGGGSFHILAYFNGSVWTCAAK